jgi:hypothetical protein
MVRSLTRSSFFMGLLAAAVAFWWVPYVAEATPTPAPTQTDPVIFMTLEPMQKLTDPTGVTAAFYEHVYGFDPQVIDATQYGMEVTDFTGFSKLKVFDAGGSGDGTFLGTAIMTVDQSYPLTAMFDDVKAELEAQNRTDIGVQFSIIAGTALGINDTAFYGLRVDVELSGTPVSSVMFPLGMSDSPSAAQASASAMAAGQNSTSGVQGDYSIYEGGTQQACIDYWTGRYNGDKGACVSALASCMTIATGVYVGALIACVAMTGLYWLCVGAAVLVYAGMTADCCTTFTNCVRTAINDLTDHLVQDCNAMIYQQ